MLLTGILLSHVNRPEANIGTVARLAQYGSRLLAQGRNQLRHVCELTFERAVFLGSGPLLGCAEECHLKLQELTDGAVIAQFDSFMGFRHGPKAVINSRTLMVYLFSSDPYVHQYEHDLVRAVNAGERGIHSIGVSEHALDDVAVDLPLVLNTEDKECIMEDFLPVCDTLVGQMLGFFKSVHLGLKPDNPSVSGTISRVVQGVTIYPFTK
jgi:tagatose-6-phosphate ketose/aldose isomerase